MLKIDNSKGYSKSIFGQDSPPPTLFALVRFRAPSPLKGTFVVVRTHPLPLNFYTSEIYRKEINNEY